MAEGRRGTRKRYLYEDQPRLPRTTSWRWQQEASRERPSGATNSNIAEFVETNHEAPTDQELPVNSEDELTQQELDVQELVNNENVEHDSPHISDIDETESLEDLFDDIPENNDEDDCPNQSESDDGEYFQNFKAYDRPLFANIPTTCAEAILLIMNFVLKYNLPWVAMEDLFNLLNTLFQQPILPHTKYIVTKLFGGMNSGIAYHFYCPDCQNYLGKRCGKHSHAEKLNCIECHVDHKIQCLLDIGNFYVTSPIANQLTALLRNKTISEVLDKRLREVTQEKSTFEDITDGHLYKKVRRLHCRQDDITLTFNTDGSPVFKSSKYSIWPLQAIINELPPKLRWQNVIVAGLWFGKSHPNMTLFLNSFVQEIKEIADKKITWRSVDNVEHRSRVFVICACLDSPARAIVQNTKQYNGYFGCGWCLHPGVSITGTTQVRYTVQAGKIKDRTDSRMKLDMQKALAGNAHVHGVKGPSPLINLEGFDIVWGFSPDYMHSVLLGVCRQITEIWFTAVGQPCYIGSPADTHIVDTKLLSIKTPHIFTRLPRSIGTRSCWKASEWKQWLFYFSVPCVQGLIPDRYLHHWCLLVHAIYLSVKSKVTASDINKMDELLIQFVMETQMIYGELAMTSNIHQLLHHAKSVKLLGPASCRSAFVFEGNNGALLKLVTAAKGVPTQILNRYLFKKKLEYLCNSAYISTRVQASISDLHSYSLIKHCVEVKYDEKIVHMLGKSINWEGKLSAVEIEGICVHVPNVNINSVRLYGRLLISNSLSNSIYHCDLYSRTSKTDNTVVRAHGNRYFKCNKFLTFIDANSKFYSGAIVQELLLLPTRAQDFTLPHVLRCELPPNGQNVSYIEANNINCICLFINFRHAKYVCNIPNDIERD